MRAQHRVTDRHKALELLPRHRDSDGCVVLWDLATRRPCQQDRYVDVRADLPNSAAGRSNAALARSRAQTVAARMSAHGVRGAAVRAATL